MFLELNVSMRVQIPDSLNTRLESGEPDAFLELERSLTRSMEAGGQTVAALEIQDAGPHNTIFKENRPSKFTGKVATCTSPCIDNYCPVHGIEATKGGK